MSFNLIRSLRGSTIYIMLSMMSNTKVFFPETFLNFNFYSCSLFASNGWSASKSFWKHFHIICFYWSSLERERFSGCWISLQFILCFWTGFLLELGWLSINKLDKLGSECCFLFKSRLKLMSMTSLDFCASKYLLSSKDLYALEFSLSKDTWT